MHLTSMPKLVVHNHLPRPSGPRRPKGSGPNFGRPCVNQVSRGADDLRNKGFCLAEVGGPAKEMMDCSRNAPHLKLHQRHSQKYFHFLSAGCCHKCSAAAFGAAHKISADPQEDQRWKTVRCSLRPQFSSIHGLHFSSESRWGHRNRMVFRGRTGCQRRWCELGLLRPQGELC